MATTDTSADTSELARRQARLQQIADEERDLLHQQQVASERRRGFVQQQANLDAIGAGADERIAMAGQLVAVDAVLTKYQRSLYALQERRSSLNADIQGVQHHAALVRNELRQRLQLNERERREIEVVEWQLTTRRTALKSMEQEEANLRARLHQLIGGVGL